MLISTLSYEQLVLLRQPVDGLIANEPHGSFNANAAAPTCSTPKQEILDSSTMVSSNVLRAHSIFRPEMEVESRSLCDEEHNHNFVTESPRDPE